MNRIIATGCIALVTAGVLAAATSSVQAASAGAGRALVVVSVTPAPNQSTLPDLSDPGLNNRVTVTFSTRVAESDVLDASNRVNGLSANVDFHDQSLAAVPGAAYLRGNVLSIDPFAAAHPTLPQGRYTLTLKSSIHSARGRSLNGGAFDSTTAFSVGSDVYPPVLLRVSPTNGDTGVGLRRAIVVTFDEPVDAASASASVRLEDRSTSPPTLIPARVRLARHGFDAVVTPASRAGYPAGTDLTLVIASEGGSTVPSSAVLTDAIGIRFTRDAGPQWSVDATVSSLFHSGSGDFDEATGDFTMTFRTKGVARSAR